MNRPSLLRCFWTICKPSPGALVTASALLAYGSYLALRRPVDFRDVIVMTLVGQMLAASTGFRDRLARGHFDPILAGRTSRVAVALAHAAISIVPGLVFWTLVGGLELLTHTRRSIVFSPGGIAAIVHISVFVWTVSLALGRHTGGVLWICGLFLLAGSHHLHTLQETYGTSSASLSVSAAAAGAGLLWPPSLLGNGGYVEPLVLVLVVAAIAAVFVAGIAIVGRLDAPLREPA